MKTAEQIERARGVLREALTRKDLSDSQFVLLTGMLQSLVWIADGKHSSTMNDLLAGRPIIGGKNENDR